MPEKIELKNAVRRDVNGWVYLKLEGTPNQIGYQHGYLLAEEIKEALRVNRFLCLWETGDDFDVFTKQAKENYLPKMDEQWIAEIQGIADGASEALGEAISFDEILTWNSYFELVWYWWPNRKDFAGKRSFELKRGEHCSAFVATGEATISGEVVMAHASWDSYIQGQFLNVVLDITPDKGHRMLMQSLPGYISSMTDFVVNSAGLMVTETTIGGYSKFNDAGTPAFCRSRKAYQYAGSIDQWIDMYSTDNNGAYACSWLLAEASGHQIARFELGFSFQGLEKKTDGWFSGENVATNLKIRNQECNDNSYSDIRQTSGARRVRWKQLMSEHYGAIDATLARHILSDHHDTYLNQNSPSSRSICGHYNFDDAKYAGMASRGPHYAFGSNDAKVVTSELASNLQFQGRWGHPCGLNFYAEQYIEKNPQYDWMKGYLKDKITGQWTTFPE